MKKSKTCKFCNNIFYKDDKYRISVKNWLAKRYCSLSCSTLSREHYTVTDEIKEKISKGHIGKKLSQKHKKNISLSLFGRPCKIETRLKIGLAQKGILNHMFGKNPINKGKKCPEFSGALHPNWKGGTTKKNEQIRKSIEYKSWRNLVFERDNYTCVWCGKVNGYIEADHIKPFAYFPELRFELDNGRTLCKECHKKTDTYGNRVLSLKVK